MILTLRLSIFFPLFFFFLLAEFQRIKFPSCLFLKGLAYFIFERSFGLERKLSNVQTRSHVQTRLESLRGVSPKLQLPEEPDILN